nr:hypothetical protein [Tanacetum cinerariifolium]
MKGSTELMPGSLSFLQTDAKRGSLSDTIADKVPYLMKCQQGKSQSLVTAKADISETNAKASVQNISDPAPTCQSMASVQDSTDPALTRQSMASAHNSSDPAPECQTMALEHGSLSPGRNCQENVSHRDKTEPHAENAQVADDEFINIFSTPVQEQWETSSRHVDSSNMHTFYQR